MTASGLPIRERFEKYVLPEPNSGCHFWVGALDPHGYGALTINGVTAKAHRLSYEFSFGPIPEGFYVLHRCDTPACVNPDHLFLGTHVDNLKDMWAKGRGKGSQLKGSQCRSAKITEADVTHIRRSKEPSFVLADRYGLKRCSINDIRRRKTWKNVT